MASERRPQLRTVTLSFDNGEDFPIDWPENTFTYENDSEQPDGKPVGDELLADLREAEAQGMRVELFLTIRTYPPERSNGDSQAAAPTDGA